MPAVLPPLLRVALFLAGYLLVLFATSVFKDMAPPRYADLLWGTISALGLVALTWMFLRRERRRFADVGMQPDSATAWRVAGGLAGGVAVYALALLIISVALGPLRLAAPTWPGAARWASMLVSYLALSCMEELGFRAYALRTLVPAVGRWAGQIVIAVLFGLSHLAYGWSFSSIFMGVIPSGLLFGAVAMRRGGLALAIGVHAGVNLAQWIVGEKGSPGVWTIGADPAATARLASNAPWLATCVTLSAAVVVWCWPSRHPTGHGATDTAAPHP